MGPLVYRPYLRRLESRTICRCHYKGNTFSSIILRPWVLIRPGFEPATSRRAVRRSTTKLTSFNLIWGFRYLQFKPDALHFLDMRHPWRFTVTLRSLSSISVKFGLENSKTRTTVPLLNLFISNTYCISTANTSWWQNIDSPGFKNWERCVVLLASQNFDDEEFFSLFLTSLFPWKK